MKVGACLPRYQYHDSNLSGFTLGPRREAQLSIVLDPVWNDGRVGPVSLRFGGIENLEEVANFFQALPQPLVERGFIAEIMKIKSVGKGRTAIEFDRFGVIEIHSTHVTESKTPPDNAS